MGGGGGSPVRDWVGSGCLPDGLVALAVVVGPDAGRSEKRSSHRLGAAEAAVGGNLLDWAGRAIEKVACGLDPDAFDEARRRRLCLLGEQAPEVALGQRRAARELFGG